MRITLAHSPQAGVVIETSLDLPAGSTVEAALNQFQGAHLDLDPTSLAVSVWGRRAHGQQVLMEGDRVELTRELRVDPKVARRERFQKQGQRRAGLFSRRAKP